MPSERSLVLMTTHKHYFLGLNPKKLPMWLTSAQLNGSHMELKEPCYSDMTPYTAKKICYNRKIQWRINNNKKSYQLFVLLFQCVLPFISLSLLLHTSILNYNKRQQFKTIQTSNQSSFHKLTCVIERLVQRITPQLRPCQTGPESGAPSMPWTSFIPYPSLSLTLNQHYSYT